MNKKLLTLAVAGAIVSGMSVAQADVTVYGHGHLSLDMLSADRTAGQEDTSIQVVNNSSRFGIRASEDLGSGLKAELQYELLVNSFGETTGGTPSTNRDNYLGLAGGFGAVRMGVIDGAVKDAGGVADLFYREQLGESRAIINVGKMDNRVQNGLHYFSPSLGGFVIKAQYGYETEQAIGGADVEDTMMQIGAKGKIGPVALGVGYLSESRPGVLEDTTGLRLGAKATFGAFDVAALYQTVSDIAGTAGNDQDAYGIGGGFKMGKHYVKAQYYVADELGGVADTGASQLSVGYDYLFSKTTKVYVVYAQMESDGATAYALGGGGHGTSVSTNVVGGSASGISAGMIMDF